MLTLLRRSSARIAVLFAAVATLLFFFQLVIIAVAASFVASNSLQNLARIQLPRFIRMFGLSEASFSGMASYGYYEPLAVMVVVQLAIYVATEPAGEVDAGLVDLVLARPLPRHALITRSIALTIATTMGLMLSMGVGTWLGLAWLAPVDAARPQWGTIALLMVHLTFIACAFGCLALAAATWSRRRGTAQGAVAIAAVGSYLIDIVGEGWARAEPIARMFPFHYYHGATVIRGNATTIVDVSVFTAIGVAAVTFAYWQFARRDL